MGPRTFEQAAGLVPIHGGTHLLDGSAVHYGVVERMAADLGVTLGELVGNAALVQKIRIEKPVSADIREPTPRDKLAGGSSRIRPKW